jgi:uncharacterized membrane protein YfcA
VWRVTAIAVAAGVAVGAGACLQSATGFGFSLIAAPLLFAATEPEHAVGLLIVLGAEMNLLTLATEGRRPAPLRREAALILAWAMPGALAGVAVLRALDAVALQLAVTVGVLVSLLLRWRTLRAADEHPSPPPWWALPATGASAGALTTSTTTAGPPLVLYLLHRDAPPVVVRDTLTVCFLGLSILGRGRALRDRHERRPAGRDLAGRTRPDRGGRARRGAARVHALAHTQSLRARAQVAITRACSPECCWWPAPPA